MSPAAATELCFEERTEGYNAACTPKAALLAEVDSAVENVRTNCLRVLLVAVVATAESVLEVLRTDLDMEEEGNIAAAESAD